jgi:predicted nucleic acid-binding protein
LKFLVDTCVISEGIKDKRDPRVVGWINETAEEHLCFSVITLGELKFGIDRLSAGSKRSRLEAWFQELVSNMSPERVLPITKEISLVWAVLRMQKTNGNLADTQIAATALEHGLTLVTRNVKDFRFEGLTVFNPWEN